jgi:predicted DsbA family dithiol-disulfide isomerase
MSRVVKVTAINDLICSYCYIAHEELLLAISQCSDLPLTFEVEYRPYYLLSSMPADAPANKKAFYLAKYGQEKTEAMLAAASAWGKTLGMSL